MDSATLDQPTPAAAAAVQAPAPRIGQPWPGMGGIYAGLVRGEEGQPDQHLILADDKAANPLDWDAAVAWAKTVTADGHADFSLPSKRESALLYTNLQDAFEPRLHWTCTQHSPGYAWLQDFVDGLQDINRKSSQARARAVRRFNA